MIRNFIRAIALLFMFAAVPAAAQTYYFKLTDYYSGALVTSFSLPASPTPSGGSIGEYFELQNVAVNYNGSKNVDKVTFYNVDSDYFGGFSFSDPQANARYYSYDGLSIYSGSEQTPTFNSGTYTLYNQSGYYTLTIGLPEPQTWLMMIMGFGAVGGALRRRQRFKGGLLGSTSLAMAA